MNHLYDDGTVLHDCEGGRMISSDPGTYLVWTRCGIDVPANQSFKSGEDSTCFACADAGPKT